MGSIGACADGAVSVCCLLQHSHSYNWVYEK